MRTKKFSYEWWRLVEEKALFKYDNYAWRSYYYDVAEYCNERADIAF